MIKSVGKSTLESYRRHWKKLSNWANEQRDSGGINPPLIGNYLSEQFNLGVQSGTLSSIRRAIGFFTLDELKLGENPVINILFKSFYLHRPLVRRYLTFWLVETVLTFLQTWLPMENLTLQQLTL